MMPPLTLAPLTLASASAARQDMLIRAAIDVTIRPAMIDEQALKQSAHQANMTLEDTALILAEAKAQRLASQYPDDYVLGADQMLGVVVDGQEQWLDKPATITEAAQHLMLLRGRTHRLVSAAILCHGGRRIWHHIAEARITFYGFDMDFCQNYLKQTGPDICHSVGCYHIEGLGVQLIHKIEGDFFVIRGLPLLPLIGFLRQQMAGDRG